MSKALETKAIQNLHGAGISHANTLGGECAGFARENVWQVYGENSPCSSPAGLDAIAQYDWFKRRGFSVPLAHGSVPGDLLYKLTDDGPHGHVGIRITGNKVAENSSVHGTGPDEDARGTRTLSQFGEFQGIVRLPQPKAK